MPPIPSDDELALLVRRAYKQVVRERDPDKWREQQARSNRRHSLKKKGITAEEFDAIERQQKGKCRACGKKRKLVADHDHKTGLFRGLICAKCNAALGMADDSPATLRRLARYLEDKL